MHVNVVPVGVEAIVKHQRGVHKRTWIHQTASLTNLHFFHIEHKAAVEDVESHCTLATKEKNLVVGDLVG